MVRTILIFERNSVELDEEGWKAFLSDCPGDNPRRRPLPYEHPDIGGHYKIHVRKHIITERNKPVPGNFLTKPLPINYLEEEETQVPSNHLILSPFKMKRHLRDVQHSKR